LALTVGARSEDAKPMLMFVQIAEDLKADTTAQTIRLVKVAQQRCTSQIAPSALLAI
jgi:hypothetical protein